MLLLLLEDEYPLASLDHLAGDNGFAGFVSTLGQVLHEGRHAVEAPPLLLKRLSGWSDISAQQRAALKAAYKRAILVALPVDKATDKLVITGPTGAKGGVPSGVTWHRHDWSQFVSAQYLGESTLLGENLSDATWYRWLATAFSYRLSPRELQPGIEISLACHGGGGNTASHEMLAHLNMNRPTLCILDSDRDRPDGSLGATAGQLNDALAHRKPATGDMPWHVEILAARDLENLLPYPLLAKLAPNAEWFSPMERRGFFVGPDRPLDALLAWIDVGKNQCATRLMAVSDPKTKALRETAIKRLRESAQGGEHYDPCLADPNGDPRCTARTADGTWGTTPVNCRLVFSVGKKALENVLKHLDASKPPDGFTSTAEWLAGMLPPDEDQAVWGPARRAWSWGLRMPLAAR